MLLIGHHVAARVFAASRRVRTKAMNVGEIAGYVSWVEDSFGPIKPLKHREEVWELMASAVAPSDEVRGLEFGVAWGYASAWWLGRLRAPTLRWDGFDRFTGLPREWRVFPSGAFNADGRTPPIDDDRVTWHVGDVQDRLVDLDLTRRPATRTVVLFDLDVFEPSLTAWQHILPSLAPGDLLYFDEAFDADERRLLVEHVMQAGSYRCLGATAMALALEIESIDAASSGT